MSAPNPASGFLNAPVSKGFLLASAGASILWQASLNRAHGRGQAHFWEQYAIKSMVWRDPGTLLFGSFLLYYFRLLERRTGSRSHASFALVTSVLSFGLSYVVGRLLHLPQAQGPYGLVFACFVPFFATVPHSSRFSLLGWRLSDKSFIYMAGAQLLLSGSWPSVVAGLSGVAAGVLYHLNVFGIRRLKIPQPVCRLFSRVLGPLLASRPAQTQGGVPGSSRQGARGRPHVQGGAGSRGLQGGGGALGAGAGGGGRGPAGAAAAAALVEASPEAVEQLLAMGFERGAVVRALQASGNDVQAAIALLL